MFGDILSSAMVLVNVYVGTREGSNTKNGILTHPIFGNMGRFRREIKRVVFRKGVRYRKVVLFSKDAPTDPNFEHGVQHSTEVHLKRSSCSLSTILSCHSVSNWWLEYYYGSQIRQSVFWSVVFNSVCLSENKYFKLICREKRMNM